VTLFDARLEVGTHATVFNSNATRRVPLGWDCSAGKIGADVDDVDRVSLRRESLRSVRRDDRSFPAEASTGMDSPLDATGPGCGPAQASQDLACSMALWLGPKRAANCPGPRYWCHEGEPGSKTAWTKRARAAGSEGRRTKSRFSGLWAGTVPTTAAPGGRRRGPPGAGRFGGGAVDDEAGAAVTGPAPNVARTNSALSRPRSTRMKLRPLTVLRLPHPHLTICKVRHGPGPRQIR